MDVLKLIKDIISKQNRCWTEPFPFFLVISSKKVESYCSTVLLFYADIMANGTVDGTVNIIPS